VYSSPAVIAAEENTRDAVRLAVTKVATTFPLGPASWMVVPAGTAVPKLSWTPDFDDEVPGVTAMPALPAAATVQPVTVSSPLTPRAPLPSLLGPLRTTVPPEMVASPLESADLYRP
jgi:hypothetical protein